MRWRAGSAVLALGTVLAVAGCGTTTDLAADRAHDLQTAVLGVTQSAAAGQWDQAQTRLAATRTLLDTGADHGEVSATRFRQIDAALDEVQTQLATARASAVAAAAAQAAAAVTPPVPAPPAQAPVVSPPPRPREPTDDDGEREGQAPGKGQERQVSSSAAVGRPVWPTAATWTTMTRRP